MTKTAFAFRKFLFYETGYLLFGIPVTSILGDPGAVRGGGKKIGAKKSQERGEEPLGTES